MAMDAIEEQLVGSLLRSARLRLGLSQTAFADALGIAQPTLSVYESGRRQPTLPALLRMLNRAGLKLRLELVERDDHVPTICRVLVDHDVEFVIIGGMAARPHDTGHATIDVDIRPSSDDPNLPNLADALQEFGARL